MQPELKLTLYPNGGFVVSKYRVNYFEKTIAQGFGCNLAPDENGKYQVWVICQGHSYYLAGCDTCKNAVAMANNLNDSWDRIVKREKEDVEWPII